MHNNRDQTFSMISHSLFRRKEESLLVGNNCINVSFVLLSGQNRKQCINFLKDFHPYFGNEFQNISFGEYAIRAIY